MSLPDLLRLEASPTGRSLWLNKRENRKLRKLKTNKTLTWVGLEDLRLER